MSSIIGLGAALIAAIAWLVHWFGQQAQQRAAAIAQRDLIANRLKVISNDVTKVESEKDAYVEKVNEFLNSDTSSKPNGDGSGT